MRRCVLLLTLFTLALSLGACKQEGTVVVHSLTFVGVHSVDESSLRAALATRQSSKLPWGKTTYFERSRFDDDLKRIQAFYTDRGYPDARVTGFDVKLNQAQDAVDLTVTIAEGQPIRVEAIDFVGFDVIPHADFERMKKRVPLDVGAPRDRQLVVATHELALNELRDRGYPYAQVSTSEDDGPDGKRATLTFTARPGTLARFGPVAIQGNRTVDGGLIERELEFKPGDLYSRTHVLASQRRLYGMELFQFATIEPVLENPQSTSVPMRVTVAEGDHQRVNFGVGYGTEEKTRVDAEYRHVNFLGGARSAGAHVRWSSLDRGVRLDFTQPYLFEPHFSLTGQGQQWYTFTPAYQSVVTGGTASLTHRSSPQTSWAISFASERDASSIASDVLGDLTLRNDLIALGLDPRTDEQRGTLNALGFDTQLSTADSLLNAHHGYLLSLHAEQAGRIFGGTFNYYGMSADARLYVPIGGDNLVLASWLQAGSIRPVANDPANVPFSKKYFLGGATSMRGWGRYELSPLSGSGLPIGGNSVFAFSEELRALLVGNFGGVLFFEGGNVWSEAGGFRLNDLHYDVGSGLRYQTPVGPLRLDFGYQLNPVPGLLVDGEPQTRQWRVHFSIGQAF